MASRKVQGVDEANIQPSQVFVCLNSPFSLNLLFTTSIKVAQTCLLIMINPHKKLYNHTNLTMRETEPKKCFCLVNKLHNLLSGL